MSSQLPRIKELNQEAWALCKKDSPKALALAREVQALLASCPEAQPDDEFDCLKTQTYCLDILSKPEEALPIGLRAKRLAEEIGDKDLIGSIHSLLGRIYWHIDDFPTAMDYYQSALKLVQTQQHPHVEISLLNGLGMVQYGLENYTESLRYFKDCLEMAAPDDLTGRADASNNIAYTLHVLGRDQESLEYGLAALALFNQLGTLAGKMETLHSLGAIYYTLGDYDQAMTYLQQGIDLARQNNSQLLEIHYIVEISRIHQVYHQLDEAESELLAALATAEKINSLTNISLTHERLVEIYKEKRDYQAALSHFEAFHTAYKKIFNEKSDRRIKNLEILHQVELARKQADLYRELAATDFLTGLINRRRFFEIAESAFLRAKVERGPLAVIMLDIDHFKTVNDQHGHEAGDEVLKTVASRIKKSLRQGDVAGRYGGEEFVVLLGDAAADHCLNVAERIRRGVGQQPILINETAVTVTISIGLAFLDPDRETTLAILVNNADQAMYQAKAQGRDRTVVWAP